MRQWWLRVWTRCYALSESTPNRLGQRARTHYRAAREPATAIRCPTSTVFGRAGGLLSLGHGRTDCLPVARREYIDRILKGAKVAELPVVLPSKFVLTVNLNTAQDLGITIPPSILLRADEVIE